MSTLAADVPALRDDVVGIDGNLSTAASTSMVEATVSSAVAELDELGELEFWASPAWWAGVLPRA